MLEHRYYGTSIPTEDFSTENLRFLTTDQALADQAYWSRNIVFPGLEHLDLTAGNAPHIAYGGSYAGAFVAFLRKLYPDVYWGEFHSCPFFVGIPLGSTLLICVITIGAISSSGVTAAIYDYWAYFEPIRVYGEPACIENTQKITNMMDNILIGLDDSATTAQLKGAFGLPNVTYDDDFMYAIASGIESWQGKNWDPELNDPTFDIYCSNITADEIIYPDTKSKKETVQDLLKKGGYESEVDNLTTPLLNWIGWLDQYSVSSCEGDQDSCYTTHNDTYYAQDDITQDWRAWPYQVSVSLSTPPFPSLVNDPFLTSHSTAHNGASSKPDQALPQAFSPSSPASAP